jgi:hypothetical protein
MKKKISGRTPLFMPFFSFSLGDPAISIYILLYYLIPDLVAIIAYGDPEPGRFTGMDLL